MDKLLGRYRRNADNILCSEGAGYWSNLDREENDELLRDLKNAYSARELLKNKYPQYYDVVFSPKRGAGLELLDLKGHEVCVDYGCMWGALTVPLAKRTKHVLGVDQTLQSLTFLKRRIVDDKIGNVDLLCENLNRMPTSPETFDVAVVNGVLEWIPEKGDVELKQHLGKRSSKETSGNPREMQVTFLKKAYSSLREQGKLYLAIENRYDYKMFFGRKDPHAELAFTSIAPRKIADLISRIRLSRPYVNWLYSFSALKEMLEDVGFNTVDLYCCFPHYHFPEYIVPYDQKIEEYSPNVSFRGDDGRITMRQLGRVLVEMLMFRYLKIKSIAPAIVAVAKKK